MIRRTALVLSLGAFAFTTACSDASPVAPAPEPASQVFLIGGDYQSITVMQDAADTLTARFVNSAGTPVAGTAVTWTVDGDIEGTLTVLDATSRSDGTARALLRAGSKAGELDVTVASAGVDAQFHLRVMAAAAKRLQSMTAPIDTVEMDEAFAGAPVRVTDEYGNAVAGGTVEVTVFHGEENELAAQLTLSANDDGIVSIADLALRPGNSRIVYTLGESSVSYQIVVMTQTDPTGR